MILIRLSAVLICLAVLDGCAKVAANAQSSALVGPVSCGCRDLLEGFYHAGDRVFFNFDEANLSGVADATLGRQANWLNKDFPSVKVLVAGNADERGTEAYNLALGQRRAEAARNELVALGVAPTRIQTISYGKDCPVAAFNDEVSYQQNRNAITSVDGFNPQNCH